MDSYIDPNDDLSKLLMSIGSISKGFGGQGQRMGETASFNITFRQNADPEIRNYFLKVYGDHPEKINFFLPCGEIGKCISAPYTAFNAGHTLIAQSDGHFFTYIANLDNPLNTAEPYLRNGFRCSDGKRIEHQQDLGFLGKPNVKMQMSGRMFVFIKELLEAGVFQTMAFKFHTVADRDMLRKRLCFIRDFAAGINVPLTAIPLFLTKFKKTTSYIDQGGVPRRSDHFYLDLGLVHFIGTEDTAVLETGIGDIHIELFPDTAPEAVNNFIFLAGSGWFDGIMFQDNEEGFLIRAGGSADPGYRIENGSGEYTLADGAGYIGIQNSSNSRNAGSFFITYK